MQINGELSVIRLSVETTEGGNPSTKFVVEEDEVPSFPEKERGVSSVLQSGNGFSVGIWNEEGICAGSAKGYGVSSFV